MRKKRKWKDMGTGERVLVVVLAAISLAIIGSAQRDLSQRSDDEVRGDKRIWRLVCLNALGALGYYRWGRRAAA